MMQAESLTLDKAEEEEQSQELSRDEAGREPHTGQGCDAGRSLKLELTGNDKARFLTTMNLKARKEKEHFLILK